MISKTNIQGLQRLEQDYFETEDQKYEIVPGFESLRNIINYNQNIVFRNKHIERPSPVYTLLKPEVTDLPNEVTKPFTATQTFYSPNYYEYLISTKIETRTNNYFCSDSKEEFSEELLVTKSLPWVVRVYFETENSLIGTLCSG